MDTFTLIASFLGDNSIIMLHNTTKEIKHDTEKVICDAVREHKRTPLNIDYTVHVTDANIAGTARDIEVSNDALRNTVIINEFLPPLLHTYALSKLFKSFVLLRHLTLSFQPTQIGDVS